MKSFIAVLIIGLGIIGAYIISGSTQLPTRSLIPDVATTEKKITANNSVTGFSLNDLTNKFINNTNDLLTTEEDSQPENANKSTNLTDQLIAVLNNNLITNNPDGPGTVDGQNSLTMPDAENVADEMINSVANKFDPEALKPVINDSDIKISIDNSKKALSDYFTTLQTTGEEEFSNISLKIGETETEYVNFLTGLVDAYQSIFDKLKDLKVPSKVLSLHKKELILIGAKINIYKTILNIQEDPIMATLATQEEENINNESRLLTKDFQNFIIENDL